MINDINISNNNNEQDIWKQLNVMREEDSPTTKRNKSNLEKAKK